MTRDYDSEGMMRGTIKQTITLALNLIPVHNWHLIFSQFSLHLSNFPGIVSEMGFRFILSLSLVSLNAVGSSRIGTAILNALLKSDYLAN